MFCSPGFVPLTDFGCAVQVTDAIAGQPLILATIGQGHAGYRTPLDRPPRLV
jgi:hypothetical protein